MPLNIFTAIVFNGTDSIPHFDLIAYRILPILSSIIFIKWLFKGKKNIWERNMHGKVFILTGATSTNGMGASVAYDLALRGAQLIILSSKMDQFTSDFIMDLRKKTENELIYSEFCDFSDLTSVRKFATNWIDNISPRRLDGIVLMHGEMQPIMGKKRYEKHTSRDGLELQMSINCIGTFHLLNLLKPCIKSQPPDRDVRIIYSTCIWQALGNVFPEDPCMSQEQFISHKFYASSKLQMSLMMVELHRQLVVGDEKEVKGAETGDKLTKANISTTIVQPGIMRSGTLRRLISNGTVWALLLIYTGILYPFLWLFVKNGNGGAQSILYSLYTPEFEKINIESMEGKFTLGIPGCNYVINCNIQPKFYKKEFYDVKLQSVLYNNMCKQIEHVEKLAAAKRNSEKQKTKDPTEVKNDENQEEPEFGSVKRGFLNKGKKGGKSNKGKNKKSKW
ncbi:hypothetical protein ACO0OL_003432 [Hanseniaspora opuntiae]